MKFESEGNNTLNLPLLMKDKMEPDKSLLKEQEEMFFSGTQEGKLLRFSEKHTGLPLPFQIAWRFPGWVRDEKAMSIRLKRLDGVAYGGFLKKVYCDRIVGHIQTTSTGQPLAGKGGR